MPFTELSRDNFAELFLNTGRRSGYFSTSRYIKNLFTLESNATKDRLSLDNAYEEYLYAPFWKRNSVFSHLVKEFGAYESQDTVALTLTREHLMPHVKERIAMAMRELDGNKSDAYRVVAGHLALEVVFDHGGAMLPASHEDLGELGLSFDDALEIANTNLMKRGEPKFTSPRPGFYISDWNDRFDVSRMHLPSIVPSLAVRGRHVVMTPNRDTLLVTGANDAVGLTMMAETAASARMHPASMSGFAYRLDARWTPWLPEEDHPAFSLFNKLACESSAAYYGAQLEMQQAIRSREGMDVCLPSLKVTGDYLYENWSTQTTWVLGETCLLPKADEIVVVHLDRDRRQIPVGRLAWDKVTEAHPEYLQPVGLYPERYRIDAKPIQMELVSMGLKPVDTSK